MKNLSKITLLVLIPFVLHSQNFSVTVSLKDNLDLSKLDTVLEIDDVGLSSVTIRASYPNAKNVHLHKYFTIQGNTNNLDYLSNFLDSLGLFDEIKFDDLFEVNDCLNSFPPVNDALIANNLMNNHALSLVDANCAWSITTGSSDVIIGIADTDFDLMHEDLLYQIHQIDGPLSSNNHHGTRVSGVAGAQTNNNKGIAGIGYNCRLAMERINHNENGTAFSSNIRDAIWNLYMDGIPIVNVSWTGSGLNSLAATEITENGTSLVLAAGNTPNGNNHSNIADIPGVILVSGVNIDGLHGPTGHRHNQWVDLCALSVNVSTTNFENQYTNSWGTSIAAPMVSGSIGLMRSVNNCLTPGQIEEIIKITTNPILDANDYPNEVGTGYLNAYKAVKAAQDMHSSTLDLYMRDRHDDLGYDAGYSFTWDYDESPDIWVRNQDDGLVNHTHQQPEYNPNNPVYVYVRVGNKSCVPSTGSEKIGLYWSKASSWSSWPQNWDGTDPDVGNQIDAINIPVLQAGESTILKFIWHINPNTGVGTEWANCLLARIENSETDPITVHPEYLPDDVYQNNNVSMRNCIVTNYIADMNLDQLSFYIGNPISVDKEIDVLFRVPDQTDKPITDVAEVTVQLNKEGWEILREALENKPGVRPKKDYSFSILDQEIVALENIDFPANTRIPVKIQFNFLTKKVDEHHTYRYHVIQKLSKPHPELGDRWTGGIHFTINKGLRTLFEADAGIDKEIDKGENVILSAEQINEAAVYNWYDPQGNLIYTGRDLSISPEISKKYKLEVIADTDGFKDYDEVEVVVNSYHIISISPNPSSDHITVTYNAEGAGSAYLMIIGTTDFVSSKNYLLDCSQIQTNIDISSYQTGIYTVALVKDGYIADVKSLVIQ